MSLWAVLIGFAVVRIGRGPLRWIGSGHAVLTTLVVVVTANHWWLDGVVAVMLLALAWLMQRGGAGRGTRAAAARQLPTT